MHFVGRIGEMESASLILIKRVIHWIFDVCFRIVMTGFLDVVGVVVIVCDWMSLLVL